MNVLIAYSTVDGMTARIAERMGEVARAEADVARVVSLAALPPDVDLDRYDAVILAAPVHALTYPRAFKRFVARHAAKLNARPTAFISVCLAIASGNAVERTEARRIAETFPGRVGWKPDRVEVVAGALMFSRYGVLRRWAMRRIARQELGTGVDLERDTVFTDWPALERFTHDFLEEAARPEPHEPAPRAAEPPSVHP